MSPQHGRILRPTLPALRRAARLIRRGQLVAFPSETVYGLGADAGSDQAVARIYRAKGRPRFNPLIVHVADLRAAQRLARFDERALRLATAFWPGPLTLVLKRRPGARISRLAAAGLDTLAIRIPAPAMTRTLIRLARRPLAGPSANRSGRVSPTTARDVAQDLGGRVSAVIDGGPSPVGVESTVLDLSGGEAVLLRPGGVPAADIESIIGRLAPAPEAGAKPRAPGQLRSHYAPHIAVRLDARDARPGEALLAFGPLAERDRPADPGAYRNLSQSGDLAEAARRLFRCLRALDQPRFRAIAVMPIPSHGLGAAINDRLRRAAAPRDPGA